MKKQLCSILCQRGQRGFIAGVAVLICVVAFYEDTLKELEATGAPDTEKHEGGWAWTGTYDGGKTIQADVTPVEDGGVYVITMEIDE